MKKILTIAIAAFLVCGCIVSCTEKDEQDDTVAVASVTVLPTTLPMVVGTSASVTATVTPDNATDKSLTWVSTATTVATVDNGVVTAIAPGATTVTVIAGNKTASVAVTVTTAVVPVTGITLDPPGPVTIDKSASTVIIATVTPDDATNTEVTWLSSHPAIASVNNGEVTGVSPGAATITATTTDGNFSATVSVTVLSTDIAVTKVWTKTAADIGLSASGENSLAVCGNYVVLARKGTCLNRADGTVATGKILNVSGIPVGGTPAGSIPIFFLANDSKGNMIGATLPAWAGVFNIYKWTSVDAAPTLIYSSSTGTVTGAARKIAVVGDINGSAVIYDLVYSSGNSTGGHNRWTVVNGVLQTPTTFVTNVPASDGALLQALAPLDESASPSFFLVDYNDIGGTVGANVFYRNASGVQTEIQPSAFRRYFNAWFNYYGAKEWGNQKTTGCAAFWFKGTSYAVTLTQGNFASLMSIIDAPGHNCLYADVTDDHPGDSPLGPYRPDINGNGTADIAYEFSPDGNSVRIYTLFTGESVSCYEISR
ncbi:MAG: Ig-like domain-containing protein [Prevotellaceae bacterium]|jgi:hypothetical protein|nr:Ig-like domain-containing protein [Prevotellaceae bacterium]